MAEKETKPAADAKAPEAKAVETVKAPDKAKTREAAMAAKLEAKRDLVAQEKRKNVKLDTDGSSEAKLLSLPPRDVVALKPVYWGPRPGLERLYEVGETVKGYTGQQSVALQEPDDTKPKGKADVDEDDED